MPPYTLTASILSADLANLQAEVDSVATADALQVDIMDGHFVPNLSFGLPVVRCITTKLPLDIHLMVSNPEARIEEFLELEVGSITFHAEALDSNDTALALIAAIKDGDAAAGIAINPKTKISEVEALLPHVDVLTVMTVVPGFGGQAFMPDALTKMAEVRAQYPKLTIQVDGGVSLITLPGCIAAGANNFVIGSALFKEQNKAEYLTRCRALYA